MKWIPHRCAPLRNLSYLYVWMKILSSKETLIHMLTDHLRWLADLCSHLCLSVRGRSSFSSLFVSSLLSLCFNDPCSCQESPGLVALYLRLSRNSRWTILDGSLEITGLWKALFAGSALCDSRNCILPCYIEVLSACMFLGKILWREWNRFYHLLLAFEWLNSLNLLH